MVEVVTSSFALDQPNRFGMYGSWRARVRPLVARAGLETMLAVVCGPACYVPDFLTPVPATARPSLEEEVRVLAATPLDQVAAEVDAAWAGHPAPPQIVRFATDPAGGLGDLIQQIRRYFQLAIAPIWPRLRAVAEAEIAQRARTAAELGPRALLEDLHPQLDWDGSALQLAHVKSRDWANSSRAKLRPPDHHADVNACPGRVRRTSRLETDRPPARMSLLKSGRSAVRVDGEFVVSAWAVLLECVAGDDHLCRLVRS
jgi:hypothetical protein